MNFKQKKAAIKILILSLIIGVVIFTFFTVNWRGRGHFTQGYKSSSKLAYAKGISFVEYHGDKKVYTIAIDSFYVERARLGPFAIGPFRVVYLNKVDVELYQEGIESKLEQEIKENRTEKIEKKREILNFDSTLLDIRRKLPIEIKKVKGIEIKEISINLWKKGERIFRISSNSAIVDRKTKDLIFTGQANLDAGENGKLISHRIRWDRKTKMFKIADSYYFIKDGRRVEGKGIETDYLLTRMVRF
jgi:hypothetical protein